MVIKNEYMVLCPSESIHRANSNSRQELYKHNTLCEYKFREGQKAVQSEQPFTVQAFFSLTPSVQYLTSFALTK